MLDADLAEGGPAGRTVRVLRCGVGRCSILRRQGDPPSGMPRTRTPSSRPTSTS